MTARIDATLWLDDEPPTVRAQALASLDGTTQRALINVSDLLVMFGTVDTLRATLTDALAALYELQP